jgi:DNA polymerase-1
MLVDGHSIAFRAFYALPDSLRDGEGRPANAIRGFLNILFRVLNDRPPTHLAVTFDRGRPFRETLFEGYKASRAMGPEDLEPQVAVLRDVFSAWRVPVFELDGFEADDLLATLVQQALVVGLQVEVLSGDLDVLQLVGPDVRVVTPGKTFAEPVVYDPARVEERYGVPPARLRDWKALVGDASDEIPGVRGIGKKTATQLLQRFGSLEGIYQDLDRIESARLRQGLADGRDSAALSRRLVTLRDDAPIVLDLEAARIAGFDRAAAVQRLGALGLENLGRRLPATGDAPQSRPSVASPSRRAR